MTYTEPNENTLGVLITAKNKRGASTMRRPGLGEGDNPHRASLGTAFIGTGMSLVAGLSAIYGFSWFIALWNTYPSPVPTLISWMLLIVALVASFFVSRFTGDRLPDWVFAAFLSFLATAVALDLVGVWMLHDVGRYATSALTAGMALLVITTLRGALEIIVADAVLGVVLVVAVILNSDLNVDTVSDQLSSIAYAVLPAAIGVFLVSGFRRMVQVELDRVLVQSTVSAPRFAVGMLASEELARLDLAAEELLDSVATGKTPLPLKPRTASVAASLATELRLHLIEGRRETWLYHAVTESEMLGKSVTLTDKGSLAGLLDDTQRDGLLSAVWMLVSEKSKPSATRTVQVQVGPITSLAEPHIGQKLTVPIVITSTGIAKNKVDPSTWEALRRVGRYSDSVREASVKIDIDCLVDNPADLQLHQ
jgi:hypothetical protein